MWNLVGTTTWLPLSHFFHSALAGEGFGQMVLQTRLYGFVTPPLVGFPRVTKRVFAGLWWTMLGRVPTFFTEDQSIPLSPASAGRV
jgi:hypothetical protein